jgi:predicted MFS family arabinose efflux permease
MEGNPMSAEKTFFGQFLTLCRNRDYMLLWSGQATSAVGSQITELTFPLLVLTLTASPVQAGVIGALRTLPYFLFSLVAGALIDRWNRKYVMLFCDIGRTLCWASIPLAFAFGHLTTAQLYLVAVVEGTLAVFFSIAETAAISKAVPKESLSIAVAQNEVTFGATTFLGPSLGGTLYGLSSTLPFLVDAISFMISAFSLLFIKTKLQDEQIHAQHHLWQEILEGLLWLKREPRLLLLAFFDGWLYLLGPGLTLIVIVLGQHLHMSPFALGLTFALAGICDIVGALVVVPLQKRFCIGKIISGTSWLLVIIWPLCALVPHVITIVVVMMGFYFLISMYVVITTSYRLVWIPDVFQGRLNSIFRLISYGSQALSLALTGLLLQNIGATLTIIVFFFGYVILALVATLNTPLNNAPLLED